MTATNRQPAVSASEESIKFLVEDCKVRMWSVVAPSRWSHREEDKVPAWWDYMQRCLEFRAGHESGVGMSPGGNEHDT